MNASGLDEQLGGVSKSLRTLPGSLLLGSTGARLWADYLEPRPGFSGRFDFIHKINIPLLYTVSADVADNYEPCRARWYPSHMRMEYEGVRFSLQERKFISWDDCAVSFQTWTNKDTEELVLRLSTYGDLFHTTPEGGLYGTFPVPHLSFDIDAALTLSDAKLLTGLRLKPGETRTFAIAAALGIHGQDEPELLRRRAGAYALDRPVEQAFSDYIQAYSQW
ncbi:hypothetical protein K0U00_29785, partial [Paenibacillus sepulcri]|nr:hypothetical protein [Paenibacillus sepulcri]